MDGRSGGDARGRELPPAHQLQCPHECGLEEFCTFTPENFVATAVALADEREKLLAWRQGLRQVMRQSPLCDEERFLFQFQEMLEQIADLHGLR